MIPVQIERERKRKKKKPTFLFSPRFKIPLFTLSRVYKYHPPTSLKGGDDMFVQRALRFSKRWYCGTENNRKRKKEKGGKTKQRERKKSTGDISDKRKQTLRKRGLQSGGRWIKMCVCVWGGQEWGSDAASCLLGVCVCICKVSAPSKLVALFFVSVINLAKTDANRQKWALLARTAPGTRGWLRGLAYYTSLSAPRESIHLTS